MPWEVTGRQTRAGGDSSGQYDLFVLGDALPAGLKGELLRQVLRKPQAGVLLCPRVWQAVSRVLVVVQDDDPTSAFLGAAVAVCRSFRADPVVLTVARSETEARRRERFAEDRFVGCGMAAEFDSLVGGPVDESVAWVARLRRCSLVLVEREAPSWWRRWCRGETVERLRDLAGTSVLALPRTWLVGQAMRAPAGLSQAGGSDDVGGPPV